MYLICYYIHKYCEYYPEFEKCRAWLEKHLPSEFEQMKIKDEASGADGTDDDKKRQKRGGKGMMKIKKKEDVPKKITVSRAPRGKKKSVTVVTGLNTFGKWIDFWFLIISIWIIKYHFIHP